MVGAPHTPRVGCESVAGRGGLLLKGRKSDAVVDRVGRSEVEQGASAPQPRVSRVASGFGVVQLDYNRARGREEQQNNEQKKSKSFCLSNFERRHPGIPTYPKPNSQFYLLTYGYFLSFFTFLLRLCSLSDPRATHQPSAGRFWMVTLSPGLSPSVAKRFCIVAASLALCSSRRLCVFTCKYILKNGRF